MHQTSHVQVSKTSTVSTDSTTKINLCHCVRGCVFLQYAASLPPASRQSRHAVLLTWRQQVRPRSNLCRCNANGFWNRFIPFSIQNKAMIPGSPPSGYTVVSNHTRPYILHGWGGRFVPQRRIARSLWGGPKSVLHPIPSHAGSPSPLEYPPEEASCRCCIFRVMILLLSHGSSCGLLYKVRQDVLLKLGGTHQIAACSASMIAQSRRQRSSPSSPSGKVATDALSELVVAVMSICLYGWF